jgi:hypothetical protein
MRSWIRTLLFIFLSTSLQHKQAMIPMQPNANDANATSLRGTVRIRRRSCGGTYRSPCTVACDTAPLTATTTCGLKLSAKAGVPTTFMSAGTLELGSPAFEAAAGTSLAIDFVVSFAKIVVYTAAATEQHKSYTLNLRLKLTGSSCKARDPSDAATQPQIFMLDTHLRDGNR